VTAPTPRCTLCRAYLLAVFRHGVLVEISVRHSYKSLCQGRIEPLDPNEWLPPLLAGRTYDPNKLNQPPPDQGRNRAGLWDDNVPARPARKKTRAPGVRVRRP